MKTEEWQKVRSVMETLVKRREILGGFDANADDILLLGRTLLVVIEGVAALQQGHQT